MWRTVQRSLVIVVASAALGLAANWVSPRRIPYITPPPKQHAESEFIPLADAYERWRGGTVLFLDARATADYQAGHIPNAFSLPVEEFTEHYSNVAPYLTTDGLIVCYCDGEVCDLSHRLVDLLKLQGFKNIRVLKNAWTAWRTAGYPTTTGAQP